MIGDHIRAWIGGEWRHAIDCGDGTVLHLASDAGETPVLRVRRSYRPDFVARAERVEVVVHRERVFPARQVVARAYSRASDPALARMFETPAAFASWCKAGHVEGREESAGMPVPALVQPGAAAAPVLETAARPTAARAARPAPRKGSRARAGAAAKAPRKKAARATPRKVTGRKAAIAKSKSKARAKASGAKKPAKRPAPRVPVKARGRTRTAARRKSERARGARR